MSSASDIDNWKCLMNLNPHCVASKALLHKLVILTKKIEPSAANRRPNFNDTLDSGSKRETVPKAAKKLPVTSNISCRIPLDLMSCIFSRFFCLFPQYHYQLISQLRGLCDFKL